MKGFKISLAWQILTALVLGIVVGAVLHNQPDNREWLVTNILSPAGRYLYSSYQDDCGTDCDFIPDCRHRWRG
ncbi:Glutamate-aspartate carrier protein [Pantoea agglomerans]|uniref:Glutamate-aspartate carrier protein n=1 Tax=Enterobacter agglomerans TaxID=549 RepID=A0A379AM60_ENTAG|nr:Glutamate-aspartate carrier protein [Pantoea agglomerans]